MATRLLAVALLVGLAGLAWLTINVTFAARLLQVAIVTSVGYVAYLAWRGSRMMRDTQRRQRTAAEFGAAELEDLPFISIVVPARDEEAVISDLLRDLAAQRYGNPPRFEVLVADDGSTDATSALAREAGRHAPHLRVVRREPGSGPATKGAVLRFAHDYLRGDLIGILDADSRVGPDLLERVVRAWVRDPRAAALQAQRRPTNAGTSWLTAAQAEEQLMDLASQCGRRATDGTAELRGNGMFVRREALERVGGWNPAALTEDLDLSTRLAAAGEHIALAPEVPVGEQAVETPGALWRQRLRWAEGSMRRLMEHGPRLLTGPVATGRKVDFLAFAAEFAVPPLLVATIVASLATIPLPRPADWTVPVSLFISYGLGAFFLALAGLAADGRRGVALLATAARGALFLSHWLLVVPTALVRIAFCPRATAFVKTPRAAGR